MSREIEAIVGEYEHLTRIVNGVLAAWPQHRPFAQRHFASCDKPRLAFLDVLSKRALALIGTELDKFCADYKWMCGFFMKYEIMYRRNKGVEHTDFSAINERFYKNHEQMAQYMRGLMISQLFWRQHAGAAAFFAQHFIPMLKQDYDYLEIGPGHGLWMSFAASDPRCASLTGWDVAEASIGLTKHGFALMGIDREIKFELRDVCAAALGGGRFDAIVISQVLELVSSPAGAIRHLADSLRPDGLLFVNCPTRLIAPDHIRVWSGHEEIDGHIAAAGLTVVAREFIAPDATLPVEKQGYSYVGIARKA